MRHLLVYGLVGTCLITIIFEVYELYTPVNVRRAEYRTTYYFISSCALLLVNNVEIVLHIKINDVILYCKCNFLSIYTGDMTSSCQILANCPASLRSCQY